MIVEHKRPILENQVRAALYELPSHAQPKVIGKADEQGHALLSELGSLSVAEVALAIADLFRAPGRMTHMARSTCVACAGSAMPCLGVPIP